MIRYFKRLWVHKGKVVSDDIGYYRMIPNEQFFERFIFYHWIGVGVQFKELTLTEDQRYTSSFGDIWEEIRKQEATTATALLHADYKQKVLKEAAYKQRVLLKVEAIRVHKTLKQSGKKYPTSTTVGVQTSS